VAGKGRARRGTRGRFPLAGVLSHASMCGALGPPIKKRNLARHMTCDFAILSYLCGGGGGQVAAGGCGKGVEVKSEWDGAALVNFL
jgi:hypothetical protein